MNIDFDEELRDELQLNNTDALNTSCPIIFDRRVNIYRTTEETNFTNCSINDDDDNLDKNNLKRSNKKGKTVKQVNNIIFNQQKTNDDYYDVFGYVEPINVMIIQDGDNEENDNDLDLDFNEDTGKILDSNISY